MNKRNNRFNRVGIENKCIEEMLHPRPEYIQEVLEKQGDLKPVVIRVAVQMLSSGLEIIIENNLEYEDARIIFGKRSIKNSSDKEGVVVDFMTASDFCAAIEQLSVGSRTEQVYEKGRIYTVHPGSCLGDMRIRFLADKQENQVKYSLDALDVMYILALFDNIFSLSNVRSSFYSRIKLIQKKK